MKRQHLQQYDIVDKPGVYLFKKKGEVLYVGKATSLRDRVRSYFAGDITEARGSRIVKMLEEADDLETSTTDSVLEALLLEGRLIKKHKPPYNAIGKDNKSHNYVVITDEEYPRVFTVRGRELSIEWDSDDIKYSFGPFPHGGQLKEALKLVRKIFPFRGKKDPVVSDRKRKSYLNRELGLTPDFKEVGKRDYAYTIQNIRFFFEGKKKKLKKRLEKKMEKYAEEKEFEKATRIRKQLFALAHIQDVSLITNEPDQKTFRIEAYDVAHIGGSDRVGVMAVFEHGRPTKSAYRKFRIQEEEGGDTGALKEVLTRRLAHDEWPLPKLFVIDGGKAQLNVTESVLEDFGYAIPVVSVVKDTKHRPKKILGDNKFIEEYEREILLVNTEAHRFAQSYHRQVRKRRMK